MKRNIRFILIILLMALLVGCSAQSAVDDQKVNRDNIDVDDKIDLLNLSSEELDAYNNFTATYDEEELRGLEPISVMKLYIHASMEKSYETEWELYMKRDNQLGWDKEYHMNIPDSDRMTDYSVFENAVNIDISYSGDDQYAVITWEDEYLEEYDSSGNPYRYGFSLAKSEEGIWKVSFLPMQ